MQGGGQDRMRVLRRMRLQRRGRLRGVRLWDRRLQLRGGLSLHLPQGRLLLA